MPEALTKMSEKQQQELNDQIAKAKFAQATLEKFLDDDTGEEVKAFVVTDETVDREGDIISIDGWQLDNFKRNPVMLWSHNPFEPNLGKWKNIKYRTIDGKKKLTMEPDFHRITDMSKAIAEMVDKGYMLTTSVGFRPFEQQGNIFTKQELLEVSFVNIPANPEATDLALSRGFSRDLVSKLFLAADESKGVIPFRTCPMADQGMSWDGPAEMAAASIDDLKAMCAWYDAENADVKSSYKLPHHEAAGQHPVVWRGVVAAMGALLGARGGVNIPSGDRKGVYVHLSKHYQQFDVEPPEFKEYTEAELKSLFADLYPANLADMQDLQKQVDNLIAEIKGLKVAAKAKSSGEPASRQVKGRSGKDAKALKERHLVQTATKALNAYLHSIKQP